MTLGSFKFNPLTRKIAGIDDGDAFNDWSAEFRPPEMNDSAEANIFQVRVGTLQSNAKLLNMLLNLTKGLFD